MVEPASAPTPTSNWFCASGPMPEKSTIIPSGTALKKKQEKGGMGEEEKKERETHVKTYTFMEDQCKKRVYPRTGSTQDPTMPARDGIKSNNSEPSEIMLLATNRT